MPLDLSTDYSLHLQQLKSMAPFIWLYEMVTPLSSAEVYRYTNYTEQVAYGEDSEGNPKVYYPVPVVMGGIKQDGDQGLPTLDISLGIAGPITSATVDAARGFHGQPLRLFLVDSLNLDNPVPAISEEGEIVECSVASDGLSLRVASGNLFRTQFPAVVYSRSFCVRWVGDFGGSGCGYNLNATGAGFSGCGVLTGGTVVAPPYTLEACILVGDDEEANANVGERLHPRRFGGTPGMRSNE